MAGGDALALELLYDRYATAIMTLGLRLTGDRVKAEKIVEEAFWTIWQQARKGENPAGVHAAGFCDWLFSISRSLTLAELNRSRVAHRFN